MSTERNQTLATDIAAVCARVGLDALAVDADDGGPRGLFPPEYGETTDANWVFYVPLDAFASLQWMIVDKAGERKAYCYGHD